MLGHLTDDLVGDEFMPHGMCVLWRPDLIWLHAISDGLIALSYYSIPFALLYFLVRRKDLVFPGVVAIFAAFILACGTTHLMSIWTLWYPDYWLDGGIKAVTAIVSIVAAILLWRLMPDALAMPSSAQLATANRALALQIDERSRAEERARGLNQQLERRVGDRTADLEAANARLRAALAEKDVLLRELQHRVKNNLQIVSSLISLQARKMPVALRPYFQESLERIGAIGRVHEQLYRGEGAGMFEAGALIQTICQDLSQVHGAVRDRISCRFDASGPADLPLDVATPLALIVNEAVSNAFKHGFVDGRRGEIAVTLTQDAAETRLEIKDDGIGFAADEADAKPGTMGLQLIRLLARQIGGTSHWGTTDGVCFVLVLPRT